MRSIAKEIKNELIDHLSKFKSLRDSNSTESISKESYRLAHASKHQEKIRLNKKFIKTNLPKLQTYFANGIDIIPQKITPKIEVIHSDTWQSDLFRLAGLTWSVPVSSGFGRRIRIIVWDAHNCKIMGIIGLTDPIFNLAARDKSIGWSVQDRMERLVCIMDAFVLGAIPPYNQLLCGKLIACLEAISKLPEQ